MSSACRARLGSAKVCGNVLDGIEQCLFPCERRLLKERKEFYEHHEHPVEAGAPFFVDIVQSVGWSSCGTTLPTMTRNMLLLNLADPQLVTSTEMLISQGHPVSRAGVGHRLTGMAGSHAGLAWASCGQEMTRRERLSLLGSGQHNISTGRCVLFVLLNLVHVDDLDYSFELIGEHRFASPALLLGAVVDLIEE